MRDYLHTHLRPSIESDIQHIAERLRAADRDEIIARHGAVTDFEGILRLSVALTVDPETMIAPGTGEPVAILGVAPPSLLGNFGVPWLVGTERLFTFPRALLQGGRVFVREKLEQYGNLQNVVDHRNTLSINWLKRIGFTIDPPQPLGPYGVPFHRFRAVGAAVPAAV